MKSNFIFVTFVLTFLTILVSSLYAQDLKVPDVFFQDSLSFKAELPSFAPKGVFAMLKWGKTPRRDVLEAILENPCIDGVRIGRYWYKLNPDETGDDQYNWTELEEIFEKAGQAGKKIHLMIAPGFYSPDWVLNRLTKDEKRHFIAPQGPIESTPQGPIEFKGKMLPLPLPWGDTYLNFWFKFVDALAKKFGPHPALSLVSVTGPNSHNGEVNLPHHEKDWEILKKHEDYDPIDRWRKIMGEGDNWEVELKDKMVEAYRKTIERFHKAFAENHQKYYSLQIIGQPLPVNNSNLWDVYQKSLEKIARGKPGNFFVSMNGGLDGRPVGPNKATKGVTEPFKQWPKVLKLSRFYIVGFQTRHPANLYQGVAPDNPQKRRQIFAYAIRNGIGYGADFLEFYMSDIQNPGYQDLIAQASIFLSGRLSYKEIVKKCECLQAMQK